MKINVYISVQDKLMSKYRIICLCIEKSLGASFQSMGNTSILYTSVLTIIFKLFILNSFGHILYFIEVNVLFLLVLIPLYYSLPKMPL